MSDHFSIGGIVVEDKAHLAHRGPVPQSLIDEIIDRKAAELADLIEASSQTDRVKAAREILVSLGMQDMQLMVNHRFDQYIAVPVMRVFPEN